MPYFCWVTAALLLALAACSPFPGEPDTHGPGWIQRPVDSLVAKMGPPTRRVRLPPPSLSTVLLYTGGAEPGFAICEHDYYVRGETVIGYRERGTDPKCNRTAGRTVE